MMSGQVRTLTKIVQRRLVLAIQFGRPTLEPTIRWTERALRLPLTMRSEAASALISWVLLFPLSDSQWRTFSVGQMRRCFPREARRQFADIVQERQAPWFSQEMYYSMNVLLDLSLL